MRAANALKSGTTSSGTPARVLVLGERVEVALTACRALGRAGYEVGVTGSRRIEETGTSRHVRRYHRVPLPDAGDRAWLRAIRAIVNTDAYDVVVATSDASVAALIELDLKLPTCPRVEDGGLQLIDKAALADLCAVLDIPYPATFRARSAGDDRAAARRVRGPMIIKASIPAFVTGSGVTAIPGARLVHDESEALKALEEIRHRGLDPVVQEHVRGEKLQSMIIRRGATTSFGFAFRVRREFPPARGAEAMLEGLSTATGIGAQMVRALERLADAAGYDGLLSAEFLRDSANGRLSVIDVNPRIGGALVFAELLGHRLTERAVRDAMEVAPPPASDGSLGRRYHHLFREMRWLRAQPATPKGYFSTFGWRDVWDVPSVTDPLPGVLRLKRRLWSAARRGRHG